jgi:hypothetical protein
VAFLLCVYTQNFLMHVWIKHRLLEKFLVLMHPFFVRFWSTNGSNIISVLALFLIFLSALVGERISLKITGPKKSKWQYFDLNPLFLVDDPSLNWYHSIENLIRHLKQSTRDSASVQEWILAGNTRICC